jgi:hypothetical protein
MDKTKAEALDSSFPQGFERYRGAGLAPGIQ